MVKIGDVVTYIDAKREERPALVQTVWATTDGSQPSLNVVVVSTDPKKEDTYGRQTEHETSVVHLSKQSAGGFCWKHAV